MHWCCERWICRNNTQSGKHDVVTQKNKCKGSSVELECKLWWWGMSEAQMQSLDVNCDGKTWVTCRIGANHEGDDETHENNSC
jgi:hypothetical protein